MTAPVLVGPSPSGGGPVPSLTPRELELLNRIANGSTYRSIARHLGVEQPTARWIGQCVMRKLGARSMPEAVRIAFSLPPPPMESAVKMPAPWVQVLELVAAGHTNEEIAGVLGRSKNSVIDQVVAARKRLGARDRAHAAALAVALGLVRVDVTPEIRAESHAA